MRREMLCTASRSAPCAVWLFRHVICVVSFVQLLAVRPCTMCRSAELGVVRARLCFGHRQTVDWEGPLHPG